MTPTNILAWAQVGVALINTLGVPIANVIKLFKDSGGTDAEAELLIAHWQSLEASIQARIKTLGG